MAASPSPTLRVNAVIGTGHFLSHFYQLSLPPMFLAWQTAFDVSFAELGLSIAVMSCAAGLLQTSVGFPGFTATARGRSLSAARCS